MSETYSRSADYERDQLEEREPGTASMAFVEFLAGHPELLNVEIPVKTERPFVDPIGTPYIYGEESDEPGGDRASLTQLWSTDMNTGKEIKDGYEPDR